MYGSMYVSVYIHMYELITFATLLMDAVFSLVSIYVFNRKLHYLMQKDIFRHFLWKKLFKYSGITFKQHIPFLFSVGKMKMCLVKIFCFRKTKNNKIISVALHL